MDQRAGDTKNDASSAASELNSASTAPQSVIEPQNAAKPRKQSAFTGPTLQIPVPQVHFGAPTDNNMAGSPYYPNRYSPNTAGTPYNMNRNASRFMFNQFHGIKDFTMTTAKSGLGLGEKTMIWIYSKFSHLSRQWFTHFFLTFVIVVYTVGGALIFKSIEGSNEERIVEIDIRAKRRILIEELRNLSVRIPNERSIGEWHGLATKKLEDFEDYIIENSKNHQLIVANHGDKIWTFWNAVVYCSTIYTTIGYGHLYPTTTTGQTLTIVYALIGIPLFLIILTDFGKLFTRCIKFLWSFVRRLYYTGSCRNVRKTAHVQDLFKGAQMMYEMATFRRPSSFGPNSGIIPPDHIDQLGASPGTGADTTPATPAISNFEIDDEFNLPISVAILLLVLYLILGAVLFSIWERWDFFTAFYFVFVSMSTIGFGDYVPRHPIFMIVSIVYLVFGLALMSMCINVVQVKLSDTFNQASAKIGATIGLNVAEDGSSVLNAGSINPGSLPSVNVIGDVTNVNQQASE